jgi:PAS domain-containing protein
MKVSNIKSRYFDPIADVILPAAYLLIVMWLDHITPHTTITPLFGIIGLLFMAFYLKPTWMIAWGIIYSVVVVSVFLLPHWGFLFQFVSPPSDILTLYVRGGTFLIGAVLAMKLCTTLSRLNKVEHDLSAIFDSFEDPIITSDHNGKIHYLNKSAEQIPTTYGTMEVGSSFFQLIPKDIQGQGIAKYLGRFRMGLSQISDPLDLEYGGRKFKGHTRLMRSTIPPLLVTRMEEAHHLM